MGVAKDRISVGEQQIRSVGKFLQRPVRLGALRHQDHGLALGHGVLHPVHLFLPVVRIAKAVGPVCGERFDHRPIQVLQVLVEDMIVVQRDDVAVDMSAARLEVALAEIRQEAFHRVRIALGVGILQQGPTVPDHLDGTGFHIVQEEIVPAVGLLQLASPLQEELAVAL